MADINLIVEKIVGDFQLKEKQQRRIAWSFLFGIVICLIVCISIFLFANYLSENRTSAKSFIAKSEADLKAVTDTLTKVSDTIKSIGKSNEISERDVELYAADSLKAEYIELKKSLKKDRIHLTYLVERKKYLNSERLNLSNLISKNKRDPELYDFIESTSTRIGAILILIFMVQFLSRIYRYNLKLADFYGSRAIALQLYTFDKELQLKEIVEILSPDNIDVRFSKSPTDNAMELAKSAIEALSRTKNPS